MFPPAAGRDVFFPRWFERVGILHLIGDRELRESGVFFLSVLGLTVYKSTFENEEVSEGVGRLNHLLSGRDYRIPIVRQRGRDSNRGADSQGNRHPGDASIGKLSAV